MFHIQCRKPLSPDDPTWTYPHRCRACIEHVRQIMMSFGKKPANWHQQTNAQTHVLDRDRKNKIPFESVPVHLRHRAEQWFNRKVAQEMAKGIPGWPSPGKIRSLRMNACHAGRNLWNGKNFQSYSTYQKYKKIWLAYLEWLAQQERQQVVEASGTTGKVLEIA